LARPDTAKLSVKRLNTDPSREIQGQSMAYCFSLRIEIVFSKARDDKAHYDDGEY